MKDIVLISDHPTTEKRLDRLLNLIQLIKNSGKKIALASHILIPEYIVSKCDYFLYDKENDQDLIPDIGNLPSQRLYFGNYIYTSSEFFIPFIDKDYRYSCLKQILLSINYLKNKNFDIVHYVEGDMMIDVGELFDNYNIINSGQSDSVIYCSNICMGGGLFSFLTNKIDYNYFFPLDKEKIKIQIDNFYLLENFIRNIVFKDYNHHVKNFENYSFLNGLSTQEDASRVRHSFFYLNNKWSFLIWNPSTDIISVSIMSNISNLNIDFNLEPNTTRIIEIDKIQNDDVMSFSINDKLYKKYKLTEDMYQFRYNKVEKN
jgi:hypothetical protein